jgi:DNA-binding transcriptional MerR regulator
VDQHDPAPEQSQPEPEPRPAEHVSPEQALYTPGWVARRLGISATTLRSWHHRYALAPSARTPGGHRRYLAEDLVRLDTMHTVALAGVPAGEAARRSRHHVPDPAPAPAATRGGRGLRLAQANREAQDLGRAVSARDQATTLQLLGESLRRDGVVSTWDRVAVPVLQALGRRWARHGDCIDSEHLLSECVRTVLGGVVLADDSTIPPGRPVLLASAEGETHTLPLYAMAAALAERQVAVHLLGAAVPASALATAIRRAAPRSVFVWSQTEDTARPAELDALPRRRARTTLVVGGPGWQHRTPASAIAVGTLQQALDEVLT